MRCFVIPFVTFGLGVVSALQYHGADFSSLLLLESTTNVQYTTSSTAAPQPFEQILYDHGVNLARIRIWTAGTYNLIYGLKLAKRAKAVGMSLLIDLHYGDTWADPAHQAIPSGWPTDLQGLMSRVYDYTHGVVEAFNAQGTPIDFIQIGNEINDGLLWPTGQISNNDFWGASRLLHAGALAVRAASPSTKTVIHLANGWDQAVNSWFYGGIFGVDGNGDGLGTPLTLSDVDVMGFSFYPFYGKSATLSNLHSSMRAITSNYHKDIMIVETDWPAACDTTTTTLSEPGIPVDVQGQITWTEYLHDELDRTDYGAKALGIVYWEPGWVGNPTLGSTCTDNLLVTGTGAARESMSIFSRM